MSRTLARVILSLALAVFGIISVGPRLAGQIFVGTPIPPQFARQGQPSTQDGEWPHYAADLKGTRYSPLDQITAANFNSLEIAWSFKTDSMGPFPEFKLEGTPLMVKGVIYATAGTRRSVVALDAKTGELLWQHSLREGTRAGVAPRQLSGRGVSYWTDGRGDQRIVYVTTGYRLVELNARTGALIAAFATGGILDLKIGAVTGIDRQIDLETGEIGVHSTPTVVGDVVIVGSSFREGATVPTHDNTKGLVRAFDVRTGKQIWRFNTIPRPGEFGSDTWEQDSWAVNGNAGVWTQITVDEELGLVYLPVESPSSDFYGGHRPGNNLFAESLVCIDLKTGQRKWHFQFVHHPLWNYDMSSAPILADITVNGRAIKAVAVPSKQSWLYVFDRVTGAPVWPIEERPVPQSDVPGEKTAPTQPFPTRPPAYARNTLRLPDDLIDFTPELRAQALKQLERYRLGPMYLPPILGSADGLLGAITVGNITGGTNWPGGGYDPETHTVYTHAVNIGISSQSLVPPPPGFSDIRYVSGVAGMPFEEIFGPGDCCAAESAYLSREVPAPARVAPPPAGSLAATNPGGLTVQGLPILKPPYGVLAAIDMDRGDLLWQVPHGETPDNVRFHRALMETVIPRTGQPGNVGLVVTKTLVVIGDPLTTTMSDGSGGAMLRAYDKRTGQEMGAVYMPSSQTGSPMTYMVDGQQYILVAVSGRNYSGEYIAFRLPGEQGR